MLASSSWKEHAVGIMSAFNQIRLLTYTRMTRFLFALCLLLVAGSVSAETIFVEAQPLGANVSRLLSALDFIAANPLQPKERTDLREAVRKQDSGEIQKLLEPHVLLNVHLNPGSRVKVLRGKAPAVLRQGGYVPAIVRIHN